MGYCMQARGKLVDKVKNVRYISPDKVYLRKRKQKFVESDNDADAKKAREQTGGKYKKQIIVLLNFSLFSVLISLIFYKTFIKCNVKF